MEPQLKNKQVTSNHNLLTAKEQTVCMQIANGEIPHSQRAMALLALNEGNSQGEAADKTGLSVGQVKYWVAKFRNERLGIFPKDLLDALNTKADAKIEAESKASIKEVDSNKAKSKGVKSEKDKTSKKKSKKSKKKTRTVKKGKKGKKNKKVKKTKKKTGKSKKSKKKNS